MFEAWMWLDLDRRPKRGVKGRSGRRFPVTGTNVSGPRGSHFFSIVSLANLGCPQDVAIDDMLDLAKSRTYLTTSVVVDLPVTMDSGRYVKTTHDQDVMLIVDGRRATLWCKDPKVLLYEQDLVEHGVLGGWEESNVVTLELLEYEPQHKSWHPLRWLSAVIMAVAIGLLVYSYWPELVAMFK